MAHKTVVKQLMKWLPVSVEYLEMASKDEGVYKASEENLKDVTEEIATPTFDYDEDTGEILEVEEKTTTEDNVAEIFD